MRKSFIALALLVGAVAMLTTSALAFEGVDLDQGLKLHNARTAQMEISRAARLRTSADSDTFWIGHMATGGVTPNNPWRIGQSPYRPGVSNNGVWDFDNYNFGTVDSLQGWTPIVRPNARTSGTIVDANRPWFCLDWGNRLNTTPIQGRTVGIIGVWHVDGGNNVPAVGTIDANDAYLNVAPTWSPLAGSASAWCGLRCGKDVSVIDQVALGGTGNPINGDALWGEYWNGANVTAKLFPGYAHRWDQMLYRDVRVAEGADLSVSFQYQTHMDPRLDNSAGTGAGWFQLDPLSLTQGPVANFPYNFVSNSATTGRIHPIDSFMVYVGVPTDPEAVQYSDLGEPRAMYDMKRRWFSEVLKIDAPYIQILSTWGQDSVYKSSQLTVNLSVAEIAPLLAAQGAGDGGGVIRVVFRSKTNKNFGDEAGTGGSYNSGTQGAVRIDNVVIASNSAELVNSQFESASEIDNNIEPANSATPGPAVGEGYALAAWKSTGKPPKIYTHTHPIFGGDIGPGNYYSPLVWNDICGAADSPNRQCNVAGVVVSTGDHDNNEAAGGAAGSPFQENVTGMMSPTINMITPPMPGLNNHGIDRLHAETTDNWYVRYDVYLGIFDIFATGNIWGHWQYNYPALQANGAKVWSDNITPSSVWYNPDVQCYWTDADLSPLIKTSNPSGKPDSIKLVIFREQRCISFGVPEDCSSTGGHYLDNISFMLPPPLTGAADKIEVDIWDWYADAFPANETSGLPGTGAAFDTCAAHIMTGYNIAPATNDVLRFVVPGDSVYISTTNATEDDARLDIAFRIYPGPGNYVTLGNKASGLRQVPTSTTPAVSGDGSFWGQYMAAPGQFSKGDHSAGWNVDTWNSVRIDTVERNIFPVDGRTGNLSNIQPAYFQTTIHDDDPKFATLGILKNRCFLVDTSATGTLNSLNITCSSVPAWANAAAGYDGNQQTREFTKIFPDGLLTPGSHVQYFIRFSKVGFPADQFVMAPDTNRISPQPWEGPNFDGHRWQEFSILPDRWKATEYGGIGSACMLVIDGNDRRGDERAFIGLADSIGLTKAAKYGAHNGWHCTAAYIAPSDGSNNYSNELDCGTNPNIAVWSHGGSPGSLFDMYQIKAAESASTGSARPGDRLANRANMGYLAGKEGRHGPTPEMLRTYYKMILWFSGDLNTTVLGPDTNMGHDDIALLVDFLTYNASSETPRGFWAIGNGFVESEDWGDTGPHTTFVTNYLAASLRDASYFSLQGMSSISQPDLIPTSVITTGGEVYAIQNSCLWTDDVLNVNAGVSGATPASYYQNIGANGPYVSGVYAPSTTGHPFITLVDGFDLFNLRSQGGMNTVGRLQYFMNVLVNTFGSICPFVPELTVDVPTNTARNVDFLGNVWGNPMVAGGKATVHFGLAKADRVEVKVYDVTGRLVKSLADRNFDAGAHSLVWDGTNDQGRTVSRGVYFTQVKFINSNFVDAKKVTVLK